MELPSGIQTNPEGADFWDTQHVHEALHDAGVEQNLRTTERQLEKAGWLPGAMKPAELRDELDRPLIQLVVESLEAALWCFYQTDNFEAAILRAVNLGQDADTTAAVCGQIAGAYYGEQGIPPHWLELLCMRDEIRCLAEQLAEASN